MDTLNDIISGLKFGDLDPIEAHDRVLALFNKPLSSDDDEEDLTKELELLADSCDSNYALEVNGYSRGVLDALDVVNKYFDLADVVGRSEQLVCDCTHTQACKICAKSKDIDWDDSWDEAN